MGDLKFRYAIWTSKDGRERLIKDMTTEHIERSIAFFEPMGKRKRLISYLRKELELRKLPNYETLYGKI